MAKQTIKKPSKIDKENKKDTKKIGKKEVKKIAKKEVIKQTSVKVKVKKVQSKPEPKTKKTTTKIERKQEPERTPIPAIISREKNNFQDKLDNITISKNASEAKELSPDIIKESEGDREKKTLMWGGVSIFMIITVIIWIYNIQIMMQSPKKTDTTFNEFRSIKSDYTDNMQEVRQELQRIKEQLKLEEMASINANTAATTSEIFSTTTKEKIGVGTTTMSIPSENIDQLKTILEDKNKSFPE